ncbi:MAG: xanthine dehydrogenase family protein subunit M [Desulfobacteraceae bacterium]|nr:MAG: xanthine dehydrogenase family protein subunit M [Desulfobacteraceae bacterium]
MLLPKFEYHDPGKLTEACRLMAELGQGARLLAGGTDLLVNMKKSLVRPQHVVSLGRIPELASLKKEGRRIRIGSCVNIADIAREPVISERLTALSEGALSLGSPLIRNLATIGGNIVTARPAADMPPPLIAYGAKIKLQKKGKSRTIPLDAFFTGPGSTVLEHGELLSEIMIEMPSSLSGASYIKLGVRKALEISLASAAAFIRLDSPEGRIKDARIALGSVAPTPLRSRSAEEVLLGECPSPALFTKASEEAARDARPIDDFRGSAEYRRDMVKVLTRRALDKALKRAIENQEK